ncbi:MAG: class I SAM-dependent methyltransferase [Actinomycetota bacterium]|nr:class I SAM-dependent methyltransferase [Actinomycetota bacterium]
MTTAGGERFRRAAGYASRTTARYYDAQLRLERGALLAAIELAAPGIDDVLLDIGTGTAALPALLARRPEHPRRVMGVDASAAMLRRASPLPAGWCLINADARRLPVTDASVDIVTCAYLLHLLDRPGRGAALGEIARVLRPGGRAILVTLEVPGGLLGRALLAPLQATLCRVLGQRSGWCALDPRADLAGTGLRLRSGRLCTRGYTSLCLLLERG